MVRNLGMTADLADLGRAVIKTVGDRPILVSDSAKIEYGIQPMRGDASVNGTMGVVQSVDKAPGFDTLKLTAAIKRALAELRPTLPAGVEIEIMFRQGDFIEHAVGNLKEAIRDGAIMVTIVLFLFLLNLRTTFITLTAMPLSFFTPIAIATITSMAASFVVSLTVIPVLCSLLLNPRSHCAPSPSPEGSWKLAGGEASPRAGTTGTPQQGERTPAGVPETSAAPAGADARLGEDPGVASAADLPRQISTSPPG